jgi:hypothetical protein
MGYFQILFHFMQGIYTSADFVVSRLSYSTDIKDDCTWLFYLKQNVVYKTYTIFC